MNETDSNHGEAPRRGWGKVRWEAENLLGQYFAKTLWHLARQVLIDSLLLAAVMTVALTAGSTLSLWPRCWQSCFDGTQFDCCPSSWQLTAALSTIVLAIATGSYLSMRWTSGRKLQRSAIATVLLIGVTTYFCLHFGLGPLMALLIAALVFLAMFLGYSLSFPRSSKPRSC